ncbi:MAG: DNA helicase [Pseudomonadota bacterium]
MKLSAPIYALKSQAKALKKSHNIPLSEALDTVAKREGLASWSLLMSKHDGILPNNYSEILNFLNPGDLVLIAARPTIGKTTFTFGLVGQAMDSARPASHVFSLGESKQSIQARLNTYSSVIKRNEILYSVDCSDDISAEHIIATTKDSVQPGSLIVVDYLQLLDEKRVNPPLQAQVEALQDFAKTTGCILLFICQLDRRITERQDQRPTVNDIRLPNPLDLGLFNKVIFLYRESPQAEEVEVYFAGNLDHDFKVGLDLKRLRFFDLA